MANADNTGFFLFDLTQPLITLRVPSTDLGGLLDLAALDTTSSVGGHFNPSLNKLPDTNGSASNHFLYDYYYRVWVFPIDLKLDNPRRNVDIPVHVWNAYPTPNQNTSFDITGSPDPKMANDQAVPSNYRAYEFRLTNLQVTGNSPPQFTGALTANFSLGTGVMTIEANLVNVIQVPAEVPVTETWEWASDVMQGFNGTEQRVALREAPRRGIQFDAIVLRSDEYRAQWDVMRASTATPILIPFYQYAAEALQATNPGGTRIHLDPARGDFRVGEYITIVTPTGNEIAKVTDMDGSSLGVDPPVQNQVTVGTIVAPSFSCLNTTKAVYSHLSGDSGKVTVSASTVAPRAVHPRPGSAPQRLTLAGLELLYKRPAMFTDPTDTFDHGGSVIDYTTGVQEIYSTLKQPIIVFAREFLVQRVLTPEDMDYWRDVLDHLQGQLRPAWMPTWRDDFEFAVSPVPGQTFVTLLGSKFSSLLSESGIYAHIMLNAPQGPVFCEVISCQGNGDHQGNDVLGIATALPDGIAGTDYTSASMLVRVRLASDTVTLTHYTMHTQIALTLQTTEE